MIVALGRPASRFALLVSICLLVLIGFGIVASSSTPFPNAAWAGLPLFAFAISTIASQFHFDQRIWRLEAPFLAAVFVTVGPLWTIGIGVVSWLSAELARSGAWKLDRDWRGPLSFGVSCAATFLISRFYVSPAFVSCCALVLLWRGCHFGLERKRFKSLAPVLLPAMIAFAMGGLIDAGRPVVALLGVLPVLLLGSIAFEGERAERAHRDALSGLALMLQRAHPYTFDHIERVAHIAERTAVRLGLPEERARLIREAARFHDIGKIAVDEQILDKPGKLSPDEYDHVKLHAPFGAAILEEIDELRDIADWIRYHHERPDGQGYPKGLAGDNIPLEAKIIAVADAFDAMTGGFQGGEKRPYREPLSPEAALAEMAVCAGTQFDPKVVEAFRSAIEEEAGLI